MKNLILIFTLFIGLSTQAQESVLTISQIAHSDGHTYTHIQGDDNGAENCFVATSSSTLSISVNGLAVDNIYYNNVPYSWTGPGAEVLAGDFGRWDDYNRVYRNREGDRPIHVENQEDILSCDGWVLGADGQTYSNNAYPEYTYNSFAHTDVHGNTIGAYIYFQGARIQFNGFSNSREGLEIDINAAIVAHMNPASAPEAGTSTSTLVDEWISGGVVGWLPPAGFDSAWSNAIYPGFAYSINELTSSWRYAAANPHLLGHNAYVGVADASETSGWRTEHIGTYGTNQEAVDASIAYISSRGTIDSYETTAVGSYVIVNAGFSAYYVEILTPNGVRVEFRAFSTYQAAETFAMDPASYPSQVVFTAADFDTTTHANPGWLRGVYRGGIAEYTVTAPTQFSNTVTATWVFTDNRGHGHTGNDSFDVTSTTRYYHVSTGVYYDDLAAIMAAYPNNYQVRLDSGHFTLLHSYEQADIDSAQAEGVAWAIAQINIAAPVVRD